MDYYCEIQPIHELPSDELTDLLSHALEHLEFLWTTKPEPGESFNGICHEADFDLLTVLHSIKKSLLHFYPDRESDFSLIVDANEANQYLTTLRYTGTSDPLEDGIRAILKLFLLTEPYYYCEPDGRDAALEDFRDMERAVFKYAESARYYHNERQAKEAAPLIDEGKKRRRQLTAPRQKKNPFVLKHCLDLMKRKPSTAAAHLFSRFPSGEERAVTVDGVRIFREVTDEGEEKIVCLRPDGTRMHPIGTRAFQKYFMATEKSWNDNN